MEIPKVLKRYAAWLGLNHTTSQGPGCSGCGGGGCSGCSASINNYYEEEPEEFRRWLKEQSRQKSIALLGLKPMIRKN